MNEAMIAKHSSRLFQRATSVLLVSLGVWFAVGLAPEAVLASTPSSWSPVGPIVPPSQLAGVANGGGNTYVATSFGDLYELSGGAWQDLGSTGDTLYGVAYDNGVVYAAGRAGVYEYKGGTLSAVPGAPTKGNLAILSANGKIYVGSSTVWVYDPTTQKWSNLNLSGGAAVQKMAYANGTLYAGLGSAPSGSSVWHYTGTKWVNDVSTTGTSPDGGTTGIYVDSSGNVYDAQYNGIYEETGAGNWSLLPNSPKYVYSFAELNGTLYAGTESTFSSGAVYQDNAGTWSTVNGSPTDSVRYMVVSGSTLYVAGSHGLHEDSGGNWSQPGALVPSGTDFVYPNPGTLLVGTYGDTWTFDGTNWHDVTTSASVVQAVYTFGGTTYFGAGNGIYTDPLDLGSKMSSASPPPNYVTSFAALNGQLFAGASNGIFVDQAGQWTQVPGTSAYDVASLAAFHGQLYFSGSDTGSFFPTAGTWTLTSGGTVTQVTGSIGSEETTLAEQNGVLYAGVESGARQGSLWTYDGTGAWTESTSGPPSVFRLQDIGNVLYASAGVNGDHVYVLSGGQWQLVTVAPAFISYLAISGNTMYAATQNGVYQTTLSSTLPGQLPEVPYAGVLPLTAAAGFSVLLWRKRRRQNAH